MKEVIFMKQTQSQIIATLCSELTIEEKKELKSKCNSILTLHETMRGAYFYSPHQNAGGRRYYEEKYSMNSIIILDKITYYVEQSTNCSCKNVYYKLNITADVETEFNLNIGFINKILKALDRPEN